MVSLESVVPCVKNWKRMPSWTRPPMPFHRLRCYSGRRFIISTTRSQRWSNRNPTT
jgi:hypothetical protein